MGVIESIARAVGYESTADLEDRAVALELEIEIQQITLQQRKEQTEDARVKASELYRTKAPDWEAKQAYDEWNAEQRALGIPTLENEQYSAKANLKKAQEKLAKRS
jgi:hypothetical protein